ncbi:peptidase dimerization domain-containing protein [Arthrobacter sp. ISL-69]|nr:peptidase dimerization domain-containing protein [Arthrobacter sp. ISL-69]
MNAASAVGAALALAAVADDLGITVKVLGTPAEETTGGKVDLIGEGFFDDVGLAMMAHAGAEDVIGGSSLAMGMSDVLYEGRPAHAAAAPAEGINALDALVVALARQQLPAGSIVSLIVTEGGSAVNVIPERARACGDALTQPGDTAGDRGPCAALPGGRCPRQRCHVQGHAYRQRVCRAEAGQVPVRGVPRGDDGPGEEGRVQRRTGGFH